MIRKIFLIHHTHFDIGFTDSAAEVTSQQLLYLDRAISCCEKDPDYRWTLESGKLLRNYMLFRPEKQKEKLLFFLRNGQIIPTALDFQALSETFSFPELLHNVSEIKELGETYGFPVKCAILDDIGGFASAMPLLMEKADVPYLIAGVGACQAELPWADLPHLFYLKRKGGGRVLIWNLGIDRGESSSQSRYPFSVYGMAGAFLGYRAIEELLGKKDMGITLPLAGEDPEKPLSAKECFQIFLQRLERENYPYEELLLQYGGDNRDPMPELAQLIRELNKTGDYPEIVLAAPEDFFQFMEEKYAGKIPELEGSITDPWNVRMNTMPVVLKNYRAAQRLAEAMAWRELQDPELLETLLHIGDHSFGLNFWGWQKILEKEPSGIRTGKFLATRRSWQDKENYAHSALYQAEMLRKKSAALEEMGEDEGIIIKNDAPHTVSGGIAELYLGSYAPNLLSLTGKDGKKLPMQYAGLNRYIVQLEEELPPLSLTRLVPAYSEKYNGTFEMEYAPMPEAFENAYYKVSFGEKGEILSLAAKGGRELLKEGGSFGEPEIEFLYDLDTINEHCNLAPSKERKSFPFEVVRSHVTSQGEVFTEITREGTCADAFISLQYRFYHHCPRIDIECYLDKPENPEKGCVRLLFPFAGENGKFFLDQNMGILSPEETLPGSPREFFFASRYAAAELGKHTALFCCPDAPLWELGSNRIAQWKKSPFIAGNSQMASLICNNICNTDAPAFYGVRESFRYSFFLLPGSFRAEEAQKCWESSRLLQMERSFAKERKGGENIPHALRLHKDMKGRVWLENLQNEILAYDFTLLGKRYKGTLAPFEIKLPE